DVASLFDFKECEGFSFKEDFWEAHSASLEHHHSSVSSNSKIDRLLLEKKCLRLDNENLMAQIARNEEVVT
ncbi:hypothetical protein HAX54_014971, partial [Datura stramonium]|nr:hypothetical protein [Datura stramonium]